MRIFDTSVQKLKYLVLKALIKNEYEHCYDNVYIDIPKEISPGPKAEMRCCIYKERAIVQERIKLALGGNKNNPNVVEVIDIACDECPIGGVFVTPSCRGCIVHRCKEACPKDAIQIIDSEDLLTLLTCTPYGTNTHRLLVRGHRIFPGETLSTSKPSEAKPEHTDTAVHRSTWTNEYRNGLTEGLLFALLILLISVFLYGIIRLKAKRS